MEAFLAISRDCIHVNNSFNRLLQFTADGVMYIAHNTQRYLDILVEELLYIIINGIFLSASRIKAANLIEHYISASIIGFLMILALLLLVIE